jgi:alkylation response protein AidB-like acyl-CoA dehydrogenase
VEIIATAQRLADETLFPAALATDAAELVPVELLDAVADAGLYGIAGPVSAGGLDADFPTVARVWETLSSGCLTTAFVWGQHLGATLAAAGSENEAVRERVPSLCSGELRAGLALGGALPGPPRLVAREVADGWIFDGTSPFVSGWGRVDVVHTAARTDDGRVVWALLEAKEGDTLEVERLRLVALNATATVRAAFRAHPVPAECVTSVSPFTEGATRPEVLRLHASFALGVADRCCTLLGSSPLDDELTACRAELDRLDPETIDASRSEAGELALRASAALLTVRGGGTLLLEDHAQRLAREALFVLVYALRPASRDALLGRLGAA